MEIRELLTDWQRFASVKHTAHKYEIHLPLYDAARICALADLFPERKEKEIITDLLSAALDEIEAAFPYIKGSKVIAEDEFGDPLYEDTGITPRFLELAQKYQTSIKQAADEIH